jgi:hypothetical protein
MKATNQKVKSHPQYAKADYEYLSRKGYTDNEILKIWDRDLTLGKKPLKHFAKPFDIVGFLNR